MKKLVKRTFGIISSFILGAQSKIFAIEQTDVYGPPPEPTISSLTGGQLFSTISSILLFIIGLIVIFNKNITKKVKIVIATILAIIIIALILLAKFVF